ncbi:uncharacterized protein JCM6883_005632 [Sporobolomyces salmoneus]|uniref:uncharacterized protein n=1 Tax=Sporobolomyces salmoneus TaxID=183962 RepID=UPI003175D4D9
MAYQPPADVSRLSPPEIDLFRSLTTHQKVLIAQGAYAKGSTDFEGVSSLLRGHVLLKDVAEDWYDPRRLAACYTVLSKVLRLDSSKPLAPQAPQLRDLAHTYYMERVHELYSEMQLCQDQFRIGMAEIEEIKQGQHDWKFHEPGRTKPPGTSPVAQGLGDLPPLPGM